MISYKCVHFRDLSINELYEMIALREKIFILEQDCPYQECDGKDLECWHVMGFENDKMVAYARIVPKGISYKKYPSVGRVVVDESVRGRGIGYELMKKTNEYLYEKIGKTAIKLSSQCYIVKFYNSLGYQEVGESYLEDDIPHIGMIKEVE